MKLKILIYLFCLNALNSNLFAQKQGNNWFFGHQAGVSFNSGSPVAVGGGATTANGNLEGTATISDTSGNLLFYTDGQRVWNKNHAYMTNGTSLDGHSSATQSAVIVPLPLSFDSFFIFTVDACHNNLSNGLKYSIVDINQSGGLGSVVLKNQTLLSYVAEKITAVVHCNNRDIWIITHKYGTSQFYTYLITPAGLNTTPVISSVGTTHTAGGYCTPWWLGGNNTGNARGYLKVSSNGSKIALAITKANRFELFDFNYTTGVITNSVILSGYTDAYGVEFSPDRSKLYGATWKTGSTSEIYQWDINAGSPTAIQNSVIQIGTSSSMLGALQIGPDRKIYVVKDNSQYLGVINSPNASGTSCNYVDNGFDLGSGRYGRFGLPTFIQSYFDPGFSYQNTFDRDSTSFTISDTSRLDSVIWIFHDPAANTYDTSREFNPFNVFNDTGSYNITLILFKCSTSDTLYQELYVWPKPDPAFLVDDTLQCFPGNIFTFTNQSTIKAGSIDSFFWSFGDSSFATSTNTTHSYTTAGIYQVKLFAISDLGGKDSLTKTIYVGAIPSVDFSIFDSSQCLDGNNFIFSDSTNISFGTITYLWNFGDLDTSSSQSPTHNYVTADTFDVKLVVTSDLNCKDSLTKTTFVHPTPSAGFSINDTSQCLSGNSFVFTNNSSISSGSITYDWYFDNSDTLHVQDPILTFNFYDTFSVKLVVSSDQACKDSLVKTIYIHPMPKADFTINDSGQCLTNNNFSFSDSSTFSYGTISHLWNFDDGDTSSIENPDHSYVTDDTFRVRLIVTTDQGCNDTLVKDVLVHPMPKADFTINDSKQCLNDNNFSFTNNSTITSGIVNYLWYFGIGDTSTINSPDYIYDTIGIFQVKLVGVSDYNCPDSTIKPVIVLPSPAASFSIDDSSQCLSGNLFTLTNNSIINVGSLSFIWNLGDGNSDVSAGPISHSYTIYDTFPISLIAGSDSGCVDTVIKNAIVHPVPIAGFTLNNSNQCLAGNNFELTNTSSIPYGSLAYNWNFGDDSISSNTGPSHSYKSDSTYLIKLIVSSGLDCQDSFSSQVMVRPSPVPNFGYSGNCFNDTTFFYDSSTIKSTDQISSWEWDFGDGRTSTSSNTSNIYSSSGSYLVTLKVTSDQGCEKSITKTVNIYQHVVANSLIRVTVKGDYILIEWLPPAVGVPKAYQLERSENNLNFTQIAELGNTKLSYLDKNVQVANKSYSYRIKSEDSCNYQTNYSNIGKSILLQINDKDEFPVLTWTSYQEWYSGVQSYEVQLKDDSSGIFSSIVFLDDTTLLYEDRKTEANMNEYCYKIKALNSIDTIESFSNEACIPTRFYIWIPSAFTPNDDEHNNTFQIKGKNIIRFEIWIYNRWGQEVFYSDELKNSWDGTSNGADCLPGYYFYVIKANGTSVQRKPSSGRVILIK